jgi:hypothetical protein
MAAGFLPVAGVTESAKLAEAASWCRAWPMRRPRAVRSSSLAQEHYKLPPPDLNGAAQLVPFSGPDTDERG